MTFELLGEDVEIEWRICEACGHRLG